MAMPPRLRRSDVPGYLAERYGITIAKATLDKLASIGGGPAMEYFGRIPLYPVGALDEWASAKLSGTCLSTSDKSAA